MQERDPLALGAEARRLVDEANAVRAAAIERRVEIVDGEANMVNARPALRDELPDRRIRRFGLQKLDERLAGREARDLCAVRVIERDLGQPEDISVERNAIVEAANRDPDVGDSSAAAGGFLH